jgi:hypothetical protein
MLNRAQLRVVEIGLRRIEIDLAWIEQLVRWTYDGVLVSFIDDVTDVARSQLEGRLVAARDIVQGLKDRLALGTEQIPKSRKIAGDMAHLWVISEETKSRYLRGYGDVDFRLPGVLDPPMQQLGDLLLEVQAIAQSCRSSSRNSGSLPRPSPDRQESR